MKGDIFEALTLGKKYNLKVIVGAELYYVNDKSEKDKSNRHIIIISLNNEGYKQLNKIISESYIDGLYYKPRIDKELLFSLNPNNFIITTACVSGINNDENLILELKDYFKDNFYLEVQNHNELIQKDLNLKLLEYSNKYNIPIIHANDSHYIDKKGKKYRDLFLNAKGIIYDNENEFILDYPDYNTIIKRYEKQDVLNKEQILKALNNTLIFNEKCEELTLINDDIKIPKLSNNPNKELKDIINKEWNNIKNTIPIIEHSKYKKAIKEELNVVINTNMSNYFLIDYFIVKIAKEKYNGVLTKTGRGSAPSFYITKLLGLTEIDRINAPITLYPSRFASETRLLESRSIFDIDLNTANQQPFIDATKELLGDEKSEWMISWKPLKKSSAFRLYCKAIGLNISDYNEIAKNIEKFEKKDGDNEFEDIENEEDEISIDIIKEHLDDYWSKIIEDSKPFIGVVESISPSPCSILLSETNISEEIGLLKIKDKICCFLDSRKL